LDDQAFEKRLLRRDDPAPSAERTASFTRTEKRLQALGLLDHEVDLHAAARRAVGSGTLAFYDPITRDVSVRGTDTSTPATRVTLAHELTHALQDQHFDLRRMQVAAARHGNSSVVKAIIEGDATYVQHQFVSKLSDASQQAYVSTEAGEVAQARALDVPEVIKVELGAPYALGEGLVAAVRAAQGRRGVDALFRDPPRSELALVDPSTQLRHVRTVDVATPRLGAGETPDGHATDLGAFGLYELLTSRLPASEAMDAADLWRGDRLVQFTRGGRTCVKVDLAGADAQGSATIRHALERWSAASPETAPAVAATAGHGNTTTELTSCQPAGAGAPIAADALLDATKLLAERNLLAPELAAVGTPDRARCVATRLVADAGFRGILDDADAGRIAPSAAQQQVLLRVAGLRDQILAACS
ncbi:MAG TPA: hypothetical protein VFC99_12195, partial [Acidimicrobiia bacterium]|nr:hypothetical protein [Acidimicrobiia bacterium]